MQSEAEASDDYAATNFALPTPVSNRLPETHMRCIITASLRATATRARFAPRLRAMATPQAWCSDGGRPLEPLEPYQLISQYTLEPLLRSIVETLPNIEVRFSCELLSFVQDGSHVTATIREPSGTTTTVEAVYMVGCDGGASFVRRQLGIRLAGEGNIRKMRQAHFHCPALYEAAAVGKGRHYHIADGPLFPFLILQDSTRHWSLHAAAATDAEMAVIFRGAIAMDVPFEMLSVNEWTQHLLCAERYGDNRVFLAGDAAHLVIPTGGLGMNTGIGDATDLAWKLAGTLHGWGGPALLASYELERRQVGLRNVAAAGAAMSGRLGWRAAWRPDIREPSGDATRIEICRRFDTEQRKITEISGIECGYRYVGSPVIAPEQGEGPDPNNPRFVPTTWPGARLPHVWLADCAALHDRLGTGFTLLRLGGTCADSTTFENAVRHTGAPLEVLDVPDPARARPLRARPRPGSARPPCSVARQPSATRGRRNCGMRYRSFVINPMATNMRL